MNLYIQSDQVGDRSHVTVMGEMDMANADVLGDYLNNEIQSEQKDLFLNLAELSFIDSTGLAVLLNTRLLLHSLDRSLVLVCPSPAVARVLQVTGLDEIFETDVAEASVHAGSAARVSA